MAHEKIVNISNLKNGFFNFFFVFVNTEQVLKYYVIICFQVLILHTFIHVINNNRWYQKML